MLEIWGVHHAITATNSLQITCIIQIFFVPLQRLKFTSNRIPWAAIV